MPIRTGRDRPDAADLPDLFQPDELASRDVRQEVIRTVRTIRSLVRTEEGLPDKVEIGNGVRRWLLPGS